MKIDGNIREMNALALEFSGKREEALAMRREWLEEFIAEGKDHCPCTANCEYHGDCYKCVLIHRGHRDHLPYCFWDMVNERVDKLARLTEGSYKKYESPCPSPCYGCSEKKCTPEE